MEPAGVSKQSLVHESKFLPYALWLLPIVPIVGAFGAIVESKLVFLKGKQQELRAVHPSANQVTRVTEAQELTIR